MKAVGIADRHGWMRLSTLQAYYTIAGRDLEREIAPLLEAERLGLMVWSPLAGGLLSGKFDRDGNGPEGSRRVSFDFPPVDKDRAFACIDVMHAIAEARGVSVARIAIAWLLHRSFVTSVIVGAKTIEQLDLVSALPLEYPGWMIQFQTADRQRRQVGGMPDHSSAESYRVETPGPRVQA